MDRRRMRCGIGFFSRDELPLVRVLPSATAPRMSRRSSLPVSPLVVSGSFASNAKNGSFRALRNELQRDSQSAENRVPDEGQSDYAGTGDFGEMGVKRAVRADSGPDERRSPVCPA